MSFESINPYTLEHLGDFPVMTPHEIDTALERSQHAAHTLKNSPLSLRITLLESIAKQLRSHCDDYARLITLEMGKLFTEARAEVLKCARVCDYYAQHGAAYLAPETMMTERGLTSIHYQPLGTVLGIMPWNFPFWQVLRCASANLMAGNAVLIKHASNVPQCAAAIESLFREAGDDFGAFINLPVFSHQIPSIINDCRVHGISLTGSEAAGRSVAATSGHAIKKCVLELGGSDPFIILADADLETAVNTALTARFSNAGQSCIAGKRFIIEAPVYDAFCARFTERARALQGGDPFAPETTLAPLARPDLRVQLHQQVSNALSQGAQALLGATLPDEAGCFYPATLLTQPTPAMQIYHEEVFGPVATLYQVTNEQEAIVLANRSRFGLGASIWTQDLDKGKHLALSMECGSAFVNDLVKSDPGLPFGGVKDSGFGRELGKAGMLEFVNTKTIHCDMNPDERC
jgi:succinate-semialdehyde dehydrogenase/glutarate-semialdehyde dehydrogenase